jgi:hypothetical protein
MIRPWDETSHPPQWRLAAAVAWSMEVRMVKRSPLDNRDTSNVAWARYRRLMKGMALVSLLAVVGALGWLRFTMGEALTSHRNIATAAGVGLSVMLGAALMGLVFLSSGSGHDEAIDDPFKDDPDLQP